MLFKRAVLDMMARGEVTIAFRWWRRPTVRSGGRLLTPIGELAIETVTATTPAEITDAAARSAGYQDRAAALAAVSEGSGQFYRIEFRLAGDDPRVGLANDDDLDANDIERIRLALNELDRRSLSPPWTYRVLHVVWAHPGAAAVDLARMLGVDPLVLKRRLRRLKALGLTLSLAVGYQLTRRGQRFLDGSKANTTVEDSHEP